MDLRNRIELDWIDLDWLWVCFWFIQRRNILFEQSIQYQFTHRHWMGKIDSVQFSRRKQGKIQLTRWMWIDWWNILDQAFYGLGGK